MPVGRVARHAVTALVAALFMIASPGLAQTGTQPIISPILTLDQERLFSETLWGKRAAKRIEVASAELAAENRRIEADLIAEERALTVRRAEIPVEEFRVAAERFDARVTEIRNTQDAKARAIGRMRDAERQKFFAETFPVMGEVLRSHGAVAVLDNRAIFLAADAIDVTDEMIARIDEVIGEGTDAPPLPEGEAPPPADAPASPD